MIRARTRPTLLQYTVQPPIVRSVSLLEVLVICQLNAGKERRIKVGPW